MLGLLVLMLVFPQIEGQEKNDILFYSLKGPGAMHAPLTVSLATGLGIGFLAQRSRFCTMGAIRDTVLFGQTHLLSGFISLLLFAFSHQPGPLVSFMPVLSANRWLTANTYGILQA